MLISNMPNTNFVDDLLSPLLSRAQMNRKSPNIHFRDRAAELLVEKLDLSDYNSFKGTSSSESNDELAKCIWIDRCILKFFEQHPHAVGVNLCCGLNTRFHRLSQMLDWPRFRWADIDTPETIAFNQGLIPNLDNYRAIGCDYLADDWLPKTGWKLGTPLVVILETPIFSSPKKQLTQLFNYLQQILKLDCNACVHVVIALPIEKRNGWRTWLRNKVGSPTPFNLEYEDVYHFIKTHNIQADEIETQELSATPNKDTSILSRWTSWLSPKRGQRTGVEFRLK